MVDCLHWIPPSGTSACHHRPKSLTRHHTRSTSHHCHQDRQDAADQGHNPILADTTVTVTMIPTEAIPGHTTGTTDTIIGVLNDAITQVTIIHAVTHHIALHLPTGALQLILENAADHDPNQHTNQVIKPCINLHLAPVDHKEYHMIEEFQESS